MTTYRMASPAEIRKLFVDVIRAVTGLTEDRVLIETKIDRRPADGLYCTLWFKDLLPLVQNDGDILSDPWDIPVHPIEPPPEEPVDHDITQFLDHESLCTVQISFWGPDAYDTTVATMQSLQSASRTFDLWRILGFAGFDTVQDISVQYGAKIQQRAFVNLNYYACLGRMYPCEWFDVSQWDIQLPLKNYEKKVILPRRKKDGSDSGCMPPAAAPEIS